MDGTLDRYHGWTYALDGTLKHAPEMEGDQNFHPEELHIVPIAVATWGPLVFVNLDGKAPPLAEVLEDVPRRVAPFRCEEMRYVTRNSWDIACNWNLLLHEFLT